MDGVVEEVLVKKEEGVATMEVTGILELVLGSGRNWLKEVGKAARQCCLISRASLSHQEGLGNQTRCGVVAGAV